MKSIFTALVLALVYIPVQAQTQLTIVPTIELPQGYEMWEGGSEQLSLRNDLVAEREYRAVGDGSNANLVFICRINSEVIYAIFMDFTKDNDSQMNTTVYLLTIGGYIKLTDSRSLKNNAEAEQLGNSYNEAWQKSYKYSKEKFNISDEEMKKLDMFLKF